MKKLVLFIFVISLYGQTNLPGPVNAMPNGAHTQANGVCSFNATQTFKSCILSSNGTTSNWTLTVSDTFRSFDHAVSITGNLVSSGNVRGATVTSDAGFLSNATGTATAYYIGTGAFLVQANGVTDIAGNVTISNPATLAITALSGLGTIGLCVNNSGIVVTCGGGGSVTSLNSLTGALSIVGTTNQINVSPSGSTITLSTPQNINTSANVTFGTITTSSSIYAGLAVAACQSGGTTAYSELSGSFLVTCAGALSAAGVMTVTNTINGNLFAGPISTPIGGASSTIQIESGGNFWTRPISAEGSLNCSGVPDAFFAIANNSGAPTLLTCYGGARYHVAVTAY